MSHLLRIIDLGNGIIRVSWQYGTRIRESGTLSFENPLTQENRKDLRWYLEDYLIFPYGAERDRANRVEESMQSWGEALFRQIFDQKNTQDSPWLFYHEAVREDLRHCELSIVSGDPAFHSIPWELLFDPAMGRGYLSQHLKGLYREWSGQAIQVGTTISTEGPFRVLLIISRPYGEKDIPLGTVARPVLDALRPFRPKIELEVLRPPTFSALVDCLADRPGHFHLVHFDGHGVFAEAQSGQPYRYSIRSGKGHLVFEKEDGTEHVVNSTDLGQALTGCKVPIFVMNACQSAVEGGKDPFSSVASQLLAVGATGVVAMNHSVYADTAALFMGRFYERLLNKDPLSEAVASARKSLFAQPHRNSVIGPLELRDWIVPTLYQNHYGFVPIQDEMILAPDEREKAKIREDQQRHTEKACATGRWGFIGRDGDILRIERALRTEGMMGVLVTGLGGIGKTELAYGFARWFIETGGCPGGVFATDFKQKADFGQIIGSVVGFGTDFSRLRDEQQWEHLIQYFRNNASLLVWDNFETVNGYPEGSTPLASEEQREKIIRFLKDLRGGKSRVLITTRKSEEAWLDVALERVEIGGLTRHDAGRMAQKLLKTVGLHPEHYKDDPNYGELVNLLKGHPRSLETVLPQLEKHSPAEIIHELQHRTGPMGQSLEDASMTYVFSLLSGRTQKHLPFLGLFVTHVHAGTLAAFVGGDRESKQVYTDLIGESLDVDGWESVMGEASRSGLMRPVGTRIYTMPPTLPVFLRRQLADVIGKEGLELLDKEFLKFYAAWAATVYDKVAQADENALAAVQMEEANLLRALRLAEMANDWSSAQMISQVLDEFYSFRGRTEEWRALRDRLLSRIGREITTDASADEAELWMFLLGNEANDAMSRNELGIAEKAHETIIRYLTSLNIPKAERKIAVGYHQLGRIAEERQRFDEAEQWYRKALEIFERLGLERDAADDYHQLGRIAEERQRFDEAEQWYRKALEIRERLGHPPILVNTLAQIGILRRKQNQLNKSVEYFGKALMIASNYKMRVRGKILVDLAKLMEMQGEKLFSKTWEDAFNGQTPPLEVLRKVLNDLKDRTDV